MAPSPADAEGRPPARRKVADPPVEKPLLHTFNRKINEVFLLRCFGSILLFLMSMLVAQAIGKVEFGVFSFTFVLSLILSKIFSFGFPQALQRFVAQYGEQKNYSLLRGIIIRADQAAFFPCVFISMILVSLSFADFIPPEKAISLRLSGILAPILGIASNRRLTFQGLRHVKMSIIPDEIIRPLIIIGAVLFYSITRAHALILVYALCVMVLYLVTGVILRSFLHSQPSSVAPTYQTKFWLSTALPMMLGGLGYLIMNQTGALMLGFMTDMGAVGIYAAATRFSAPLIFLLGCIEIVVTPLITAAYHAGRGDELVSVMKHANRILFILATPLFLVLVSFPGPLLSLFGKDFADGAPVLAILACAQYVNVITGPVGILLLMTGKERLVAGLQVFFVIANITGCMFAIPQWGAFGAALSTAMSAILFNAILFLYAARHYRLRDRVATEAP